MNMLFAPKSIIKSVTNQIPKQGRIQDFPLGGTKPRWDRGAFLQKCMQNTKELGPVRGHLYVDTPLPMIR